MRQHDHGRGEPVAAQVGALPGLVGEPARQRLRDRSAAHRAALVVAGVRADQQDGPIGGGAGRAVEGEIEKLARDRRRAPAHRFAARARVGQGPPPPALRPPLVCPPADRRIATGRMPALRRGAPARARSSGRGADSKNACAPHAPSISTSSQRAPKPPVPASGSPRSSERSLHGAQPPSRVAGSAVALTVGGSSRRPRCPRAADAVRPRGTNAGRGPEGSRRRWSCSRSACTAADASAGSVIVLWGSTMRTERSSSSMRSRSASRQPTVDRRVEARRSDRWSREAAPARGGPPHRRRAPMRRRSRRRLPRRPEDREQRRSVAARSGRATTGSE